MKVSRNGLVGEQRQSPRSRLLGSQRDFICPITDLCPGITSGLLVIRPRPGREVSDPLMDTHLVVHSPESPLWRDKPTKPKNSPATQTTAHPNHRHAQNPRKNPD